MSETPTDLDRATFEPNRFSRKLGTVAGVSFAIFFGVTAIFIAASLVMNDYLYKAPATRLLLGVYGGIACFITIPYYIYRGLTGSPPTMYALFPMRNKDIENPFFNYVFGRGSLLEIVGDYDLEAVVASSPHVSTQPHPKDENPVPLSAILRDIHGF